MSYFVYKDSESVIFTEEPCENKELIFQGSDWMDARIAYWEAKSGTTFKQWLSNRTFEKETIDF